MSSPRKEHPNTPSSPSRPSQARQHVSFSRCNSHTIEENSPSSNPEHLNELRRWHRDMMTRGHIPVHLEARFLKTMPPRHVNLNNICPDNPISSKNQQSTPSQDQKRYHNLLFGPKHPAKDYIDIWSDDYWLDHAARVIADNETDFIGKTSYEKARLTEKQDFQKAVDLKTEKYMRYFNEAIDLNEEPWLSAYTSTNDIAILLYEKEDKDFLIKQLRSAVARQLAFEEECESAGRVIADAMGVEYAGRDGSIWSFQPPFLNPPWEHVGPINGTQTAYTVSRPSMLQNDIMLTVRKHEQWIICQGRRFYKSQDGVVNEIGKLIRYFPGCRHYIYCPRQELYRMRIEILVEDVRMNEPPDRHRDCEFWGSISLFSSQKILYDTTGLEVIGAEEDGTKKCHMYATGKGLWTCLPPHDPDDTISQTERSVEEVSEHSSDDDMFSDMEVDEVDSTSIECENSETATPSNVQMHQGSQQSLNKSSSSLSHLNHISIPNVLQGYVVLVEEKQDVSECESDGNSVVSLVKFRA